MKTRFLLFAVFLLVCSTAFGQDSDNAKFIEVTGTSEITLVPDEIHYLIEIKEYWEEEFDGKSKPENYRTKVPLTGIERNLRAALRKIGIPEDAIRTQEVGDYWRERGLEFLVSKRFDITLTDFSQIDEILKVIDTKGINYMRIGELKNKDMQVYRQQGKIEALKAAQKKAEYLVEALGKRRTAGKCRLFPVFCSPKQCKFITGRSLRCFPYDKTELFDAGEVRDKVESYGEQRKTLFLYPYLIQVVSPVFQIAHTAVSMQFIQ